MKDCVFHDGNSSYPLDRQNYLAEHITDELMDLSVPSSQSFKNQEDAKIHKK